jgi:hypothetical protein
MEARHYSMLLHLIGFGLLFSLMVGVWILSSHYKKATDYKTKATLLSAMRTFGYLSPVGIIIMLSTGVWNMNIRGLGLFTESWLTTKIVFFAMAAINGVIIGAKAGKRGKLVAQIIQGNSPTDTERTILSIDKQIRLIHMVQVILMLLILTLTIVKPGRYEM